MYVALLRLKDRDVERLGIRVNAERWHERRSILFVSLERHRRAEMWHLREVCCGQSTIWFLFRWVV